MDENLDRPWYAEGLRFQCTGCGQCCTGSPGYVFLSELDLDRLVDHFQLSVDQFTKKYTRLAEGGLALLDKPQSADCIFLENNRCTAYEARPTQCRTFPWWHHNLQSPEEWAAAAHRCEGINHPDAPLVSGLDIEEQHMTYLDNWIGVNFSLNL